MILYQVLTLGRQLALFVNCEVAIQTCRFLQVLVAAAVPEIVPKCQYQLPPRLTEPDGQKVTPPPPVIP